MYQLKAPTAVLLDSDHGWINSGLPSAKIFNQPSFSIKSADGFIYYHSPNLQKKYKGDPVKELERFLGKGFVSVGYISYEYLRFTDTGSKIREKGDLNYYDACFYFYKDEEIESCCYEDIPTYGGKFDVAAGFQQSLRHVSNLTKSEYIKNVEKAKSYISSGDIYQVNLSQKYSTSRIENPNLTLLRFYELQPVPFSALIEFDDHVFISGSMELFLRKEGKRIVTKPIKGTAKRSNDKISDERIKNQLKESKKEKAENLMIVDLMRNDLGRVCENGSVNVNELFRVNSYKTLFQMESEVEGVLRSDVRLNEIIAFTFPPGSVTGAPKSRAIEIIDEIESHCRGPYCGVFGVFYPNMDFTLSVAIRVMLSNQNGTFYWVGGGIVWDSDPESEYEETLLKAKAIRKTLFEK